MRSALGLLPRFTCHRSVCKASSTYRPGYCILQRKHMSSGIPFSEGHLLFHSHNSHVSHTAPSPVPTPYDTECHQNSTFLSRTSCTRTSTLGSAAPIQIHSTYTSVISVCWTRLLATSTQSTARLLIRRFCLPTLRTPCALLS